MNEPNDDRQTKGEVSHPYRVRLPAFIVDEEVGLGDVIKQATYSIGIEPCGGCEQRAAALNRWVVLTARSRKS